MRIIIRATNWLGDAVMSLPAIRAVRDSYLHSEITILAKKSVADLYSRERGIDHVLPYDGDRWKTAQLLRSKRFHLGILLPNSFDSALLFRLAGIRHTVGYDRDFRRLLLSNPVPVPQSRGVSVHERFYYLELLQSAGLSGGYPAAEAPIHLDCAAEAKNDGRRMFAAREISMPVIGVSPGAAYGGAKRWLPERFAESAVELAKQMGGSIAIFGAPSDADTCIGVETLINKLGGVPVINFAGQTTLREFIDLTAACSVYLTNDSGSMHVASALGVPTVAVFGATNPVTTGPAGPFNSIVREPVACSPCFKRECPIDHRCMTGVTSERVVSAALTLIKL